MLNQFDRAILSILQQEGRISNVELAERVNLSESACLRRVRVLEKSGLIKGYAASKAGQDRRHALFVASDSPLTTNNFVNRFLEVVPQFKGEAAIIVPAILIGEGDDRLGRPPLRLINDSSFKLSDQTDGYGRQGFRISSLIYANPHKFDINTANTAYNLRKCLNPKVQLKLFKITRSLGYPNVYSKYFLRKDLSVKETANIVSGHFNGRLEIIPMIGIKATYDYDGTDQEYRMITRMLTTENSGEPG